MTQLTKGETDRLTALESVIQRSRAAFLEVGAALLEIRDAKLYRSVSGTFEEYCRDRWEIGKSHAYRLIEAAETFGNVPQGCQPETEREARQQIDAQKDAGDRGPAWDEASEDNPKLKAFIAAREKSRARGKDKNEVNFWVCLVFQSFAQKMQFLAAVDDIPTLYGMYVDGERLAKRLGIKVDPNEFKQVTSPLNKRLAEMTKEPSDASVDAEA